MHVSTSQPVEGILDRIEDAADQHDPLTLGNVMDILGQKSFAPVLLLIGLIMLVPGPADIPGVPVILGLLVIIVVTQIALRREHLWVPGWMERCRVKAARARQMVSWTRKPACWMDRITRPRYQWMINRASGSLIGITCVLIAMTTPVLEFIPFSANIAGGAIAAFGLALLAKDGLLAGLAIGLSLTTFGLVVSQLAGN